MRIKKNIKNDEERVRIRRKYNSTYETSSSLLEPYNAGCFFLLIPYFELVQVLRVTYKVYILSTLLIPGKNAYASFKN